MPAPPCCCRLARFLDDLVSRLRSFLPSFSSFGIRASQLAPTLVCSFPVARLVLGVFRCSPASRTLDTLDVLVLVSGHFHFCFSSQCSDYISGGTARHPSFFGFPFSPSRCCVNSTSFLHVCSLLFAFWYSPCCALVCYCSVCFLHFPLHSQPDKNLFSPQLRAAIALEFEAALQGGLYHQHLSLPLIRPYSHPHIRSVHSFICSLLPMLFYPARASHRLVHLT